MTDSPIVCDFCLAPDVRWTFPCRDFTTREAMELLGIPMGVEFHADGDWAACPACAALAVRGDRERLARRSARGFFKRHPELTAGLVFDDYVAHVRRLQDTFWANRSGTPFPSDDPRTRRAES